jgi:hypothetical protein
MKNEIILYRPNELTEHIGRPVDFGEVTSILKEKLASLFGFHYV